MLLSYNEETVLRRVCPHACVYFVAPGACVKTVMDGGGLLTSCMSDPPLCNRRTHGATRLAQDKCVTHADIFNTKLRYSFVSFLEL